MSSDKYSSNANRTRNSRWSKKLPSQTATNAVSGVVQIILNTRNERKWPVEMSESLYVWLAKGEPQVILSCHITVCTMLSVTSCHFQEEPGSEKLCTPPRMADMAWFFASKNMRPSYVAVSVNSETDSDRELSAATKFEIPENKEVISWSSGNQSPPGA